MKNYYDSGMAFSSYQVAQLAFTHFDMDVKLSSQRRKRLGQLIRRHFKRAGY